MEKGAIKKKTKVESVLVLKKSVLILRKTTVDMLKTNENTRCGIHDLFIFELSEF